MASIQKITGVNGDSYRVVVRIKGHPLKSKYFADKETAYVWGKYQEMIMSEKANFGARDSDLLTVLDVMLAKYGDYKSSEICDCEEHFKNVGIWNTYINQLTHDKLMNCARIMLNTHVYRGGCKGKNTGIRKLPEPMTILRKFSYLSSAINYLIKLGADLENNTPKVIAWLRELDKEKKSSKI